MITPESTTATTLSISSILPNIFVEIEILTKINTMFFQALIINSIILDKYIDAIVVFFALLAITETIVKSKLLILFFQTCLVL